MPTFYVSVLDQAVNMTQAGVFAGNVTTQAVTNCTSVPIDIARTAVNTHFLFYADRSVSGDDDTTTIDITGVALGSSGSFTFPANANAFTEFMELLANEVFGSNQASDYFSNGTDMKTAYDAGTAAALIALNANFTAGTVPATELIDAMFVATNDTTRRFTLSYNAISASGIIATGNNLVVSGGSASTHANVDLVSLPLTATLVSTAVTFTSAAAHGYSAGDMVRFSDFVDITGLTPGTTTYYVIASGLSATDFKVSATSGGSEVEAGGVTGSALIISGVSIANLPATAITASDNLITVATGHGYIANDPIQFSTLVGGAGLSVDTIYYVRSDVGDTTFSVAATSGGDAIDITTDGNGVIPRYGTGYAVGDTVTITDGNANTATIDLNSVQTATLNGTLTATAGTQVPLEVGDVIRVRFSVASEATQTNTSGVDVTATQTYFVDYTLT